MDSNIIKPGNQTLEEFYCFNFFFFMENWFNFKATKEKTRNWRGKILPGQLSFLGGTRTTILWFSWITAILSPNGYKVTGSLIIISRKLCFFFGHRKLCFYPIQLIILTFSSKAEKENTDGKDLREINTSLIGERILL